jgi:hypothetical protein
VSVTGQAFEPEQVAMLAHVFEEVLPILGLTDWEDLVTTLVAQKIIELAQTGVGDPVRLKALIVEAFKKDCSVRPRPRQHPVKNKVFGTLL